MPSGYSTCPECGESLVSFKIRAHLLDAHGIDRAPVSKEESRRRHRENAQLSMTPNDPRPTVPDPDNPYPDEPEEPETPPVPEPAEAIPQKPGLLQRLRARRSRTGEARAPNTGERAPRQKRPSRRRIQLDTDISDIWGMIGRRVEASPFYATGRMLQFEAPAAGVIIDTAIAGTFPDRVFFQPLARNRNKYGDAALLVLAPLLTAAIEMTMREIQAAQEDQDQDKFDELVARLQIQREILIWVLEAGVPRYGQGKKVADEKKAKKAAQIADAFPELGDQDPVQVLVDSLFTPPRFQEAAQNGKGNDATFAEHREPDDVAFRD